MGQVGYYFGTGLTLGIIALPCLRLFSTKYPALITPQPIVIQSAI
jgi:hypothetical protein